MEGRKEGGERRRKKGRKEGKEEGRGKERRGEVEREGGTINQEVRKDAVSVRAFQRNKTNSITR